jgi:ABC-type antimicrobial peptide transport system permease subunit
MIVRQGWARTAVGLGVGLALGWGLGKALESFLFQVRLEDPLTFATVPLLLFAVTSLAYLAPAWRASRLDPAEILRGD